MQTIKHSSVHFSDTDMFPVLQDGDIVSYVPINFNKIKRNDIVVTERNHKTTIHRVVYTTNRYIITKGDTSVKSDSRVYPHHIRGTVTEINRNGISFHPDLLYSMQSTLYLQAINKLVDNFRAHHIQYVLLKGLIVHLKYVRHLPRRLYNDYDVLIKFKDRKRVHSVLTKLGYKQREQNSHFLSALIDKPIETSYIKEGPVFPIVVDIHLEPVFTMTQIGRIDELYPQKYIDSLNAEMFDSAVKTKTDGFAYTLLRQDYLILYLALHFFHHNFRGIHRLELLYAVVKKIPPGKRTEVWTSMAEQIIRFKLNNYIYGAFFALRKYFSFSPPAFFLNMTQPSETVKKNIRYMFHSNLVFEGYDNVNEEIELFRNLFHFSYRPLIIKLLVFLRPATIYLVMRVLYVKLSDKLRRLLQVAY
ncbi:MAG: nucleotidyltransferase family protein [Candidatus Roizmanbacteria bacterium]|nr:nucleotidyltransferase family protein [Candidatus Roizmanbacteria bacterium]